MIANASLAAVLVVLVSQLVACAPAEEREAAAPVHYGPAYVVGGHVAGLRGVGLTLENERGEKVDVTDDGKFVFGAMVDDGTTYDVTIAREPISPVQSCSVSHGAGKVHGRSAMDVVVTCNEVSFEDPDARDLRAAR